jgi:hypothetical protein
VREGLTNLVKLPFVVHCWFAIKIGERMGADQGAFLEIFEVPLATQSYRKSGNSNEI